MGMYTKFGFHATIRPESIESVKEGLKNQELITSVSVSLDIEWVSDGTLDIMPVGDFKNYGKEIEKFMTWITPFVVPSVEPIAVQWYETWTMPLLYWKK